MQNYTQEQIENFLVNVEEQINELFNRRSTPESNSKDIETYVSDNIRYTDLTCLRDMLNEYDILTPNGKAFLENLIKEHI